MILCRTLMSEHSEQSEPEEPFELAFARDILDAGSEDRLDAGPRSRGGFLDLHWGKLPRAGSVTPAVLEHLVRAFADCETDRLLAKCRKPDNTSYSDEEISDMERDLVDHGRTLNMPFCFTRGARQLTAAFIDEFGDLGNDIEVGVYISRIGGDIAEWHCDANHNFTIQLEGSKEWQHMPSGPRTCSSRGLFDTPSNRAEQLCAATVPATGAPTRRILEPGSVLYLPPGQWHRVVPHRGCSVSIDLRVGELTRAKWIAEVMHAHMQAAAVEGVSSSQPHGTGGAPFDESQLKASESAFPPDHHLYDAGANFQRVLEGLRASLVHSAHFRPPRPFPPEDEHCDGLARGASLDFLVGRRELGPWRDLLEETRKLDRRLVVSPMAAISARLVTSARGEQVRGKEGAVVHLEATSALTTMECARVGPAPRARHVGPTQLCPRPAGTCALTCAARDTARSCWGW